jgi:two-component system, cell cycle sensor histidine kinase and response regulator CckA
MPDNKKTEHGAGDAGPSAEDPTNLAARLAECERTMHEMVGNSIQGFLVYRDGRIILINTSMTLILGYSEAELSGMSPSEVLDLVHPEDRGEVEQLLANNLAGKPSVGRLGFRVMHRDGSIRWLDVRYAQISYLGSPALQAYCVDLTEQRKAEEELRASEERLRSIAESAIDSIFCKDTDRRYTFANDAMCRLFGVDSEELLGRTPEDLFDRESATVVRETDDRTFSGETVDVVRTIRVGAEEKTFHTVQVPMRDGGGKVTGISGIVRDVTAQHVARSERKKLEQRFLQAQKMETVGRLAGGIAHDFNNLLTEISGHVSLALMDIDESHPFHATFDSLSAAARRAAGLTRQLLTFSRRQIVQPRVLDIDYVLENLRPMLERTIGEDVHLHFVLDGALPPIWGDVGQIEQVVLNLVVNARDAMPAGGAVTVRTKACEPDADELEEFGTLRRDKYVEFSVQDTGCGISEDDLALIYEPFFTTKPKDHGTGLGLAIVDGIVSEHGGGISVRTAVGKGTTFRILLPVTGATTPDNTDGSDVEDGVRMQGSETVLCVEDEPVVREVTAKLLERLGYNVLTASGGREALDICKQKGEEISLLLTDVIMPDMNGMELWSRVSKLHRRVRVLFTSGYPESLIESRGIFDGKIDFLGKPYVPSTLARKLREVLDR